jgi:hypothetical protein
LQEELKAQDVGFLGVEAVATPSEIKTEESKDPEPKIPEAPGELEPIPEVPQEQLPD